MILKRLSQPLDMSRVKYRPAPGKDTIPYLEGFDVIQTANDIFDYHWSFDLLSPPQVMEWEQTLTTWDNKRRERTPVLDTALSGAATEPCCQRFSLVPTFGKGVRHAPVFALKRPYGH